LLKSVLSYPSPPAGGRMGGVVICKISLLSNDNYIRDV
jgi:hypothetical protein